MEPKIQCLILKSPNLTLNSKNLHKILGYFEVDLESANSLILMIETFFKDFVDLLVIFLFNFSILGQTTLNISDLILIITLATKLLFYNFQIIE